MRFRSPRRVALPLLAALVLAGGAGLLRATSPVLSLIAPQSAQRGTEADAVFQGDRLGDAREILFYEPGISAISLNTSNAAQLKVRLKVEPTARLGQHVVRVRTAGGITEARTFSIGQYPIALEKEPNNDFNNPQKIALNTTVQGVAGNEDVDYYAVEAKKGQRITAEIEAMRLGSALVDCHLAILDRRRFELGACDDSAFALQDPVVSVVVPEDGVYVIAVRESSYAGNDGSRYCLHVGEAPRPLIAYPAGGKAGEELQTILLGDARGPIAQKIKLPEKAVGDFAYSLIQDGQSTPSPNKLRVVGFPNVLEAEPNNLPAQATNSAPELPVAFNGVIGQAGDVDFFRFKAKSGQRFDVRCVARGVHSPLDSVLALHKSDGGQIADNDDSGGPDSLINWTVPADGEYLVSVRDHLGKGGSNYVYRVEFSPMSAELALSIPEFARNSQERNTVSVPRGNRFATLIRAARANFSGDIALSCLELPPGVVMSSDVIAGSVNETPVVFEAATNAALSGRLVAVIGQLVGNKDIVGGFRQVLELIYGEPNNTIYYKAPVDRMAVAVTDEAPFKITIVEPKAPLVQNGSMNLKVLAERRNGFKGTIRLSMLWNPPGVGSQNEVLIAEGQTEALYPINANGDAATRAWKIALLANGDAGQGQVWTSSQLAALTVATPFVAMQIPMAAGEQGKGVGILGKLQQLQPFDGEAQVQLYGLPPKVTIAKNPLTITKATQEVLFNTTLATDAPVGQHKSLFCQIVIMKYGEPVAHSVGGGGVLRIDAPSPPKPNAPVVAQAAAAPVAAAKPVAAAPPKPLSRLEKLRLEARERGASGAQ
ncbi:MAG: PPC domain-containing protein [Verrucomicrobia bacterium]|nr:PPC domain-containing protein [Verrucomicrobiota bacterium]MBI3870310.1 PPC domain-containing protein [Verrucomicrobiota bacterium]